MTITGLPLFVLCVCALVGGAILSFVALVLAITLIRSIWRWFTEQLFEAGLRIAARRRKATEPSHDQ